MLNAYSRILVLAKIFNENFYLLFTINILARRKKICYDQSKVKILGGLYNGRIKNNSVVEEDTEGTVVVITDEEGNEYNYVEEMVFDAGSDKYAILVSIDGDEECECHEHDEECGCEEEVDVILAKIVKDENGEVEYIEPTDEEFEIAQQAYEELMDKLEAEE